MKIQSSSQIISGLRGKGIKFDYKNHSDNETTNVDVYEELNSLYDDYKKQLYTEEPLQVNVQMNFDMIQYTAVWLGKRNTPDSLSYQNAVRQFFIERMQNNDYSILDSIILNNKKYIYLIFNDIESLKVVKNYFNVCKAKVEELKAKYEQNTISKQEKDLLIKMLMNTLFRHKYSELKDKLLKDAFLKNELTKVETEFLSREVAYWKTKRKNIPYVKPYIIERDEKGELPSYGGVQGESLVYINYNEIKKSSHDLIWVTLHEYEHHLQAEQHRNGILTKNSLARAIFRVLALNSKEEYERNYEYKGIEVYANARAQAESIFFKIEKFGYRGLDKIKEKVYSYSNYNRSIQFGYQTDEKNDAHTIDSYNMQQIEKILQENESFIKDDKIIPIIYNRNQKRLKNIFELSDEYIKQPIDGKDALSSVVEYQILKGDLNNINFNEMSKEEITNILLLLSRQLKHTMTRLYNYVGYYRTGYVFKREEKARNDNLDEIILILKNEISFIKNNIEIIKSLVDDWPKYIDEENIRIEIFEQADVPEKMLIQSAQVGLGTQSNNPLLFIERLSSGDIVEMLKNNQRYKHLDAKQKEYVEGVFQKIRTEVESIDDYGGINI